MIDCLPRITYRESSSIKLDLVLRNVADREVRYLKSDAGPAIAGIYPILQRDGKLIPPLESGGRRPVPRDFATLRPGESLRWQVDISETYGPLGKGVYELRISYSGVPDSAKTDAFTLDRAVAILEVAGD